MTIPSNDPNKSMNGSSSVFTEEMAQYVQVYIDESEEELEGLVEAILKLESNPRDSEALNKSFRMLHSLKGSSGMLGFEVVGNFAHELEDRFERYRSGKSVLDPETTTLILQCLDYFRSFLERLRSNDASEGDPAPLLKRLQELEGQKTSVSSSTKNGPDVLLHSSAGNSTSGSSNESLKLPAMTVSGGLQIVVRFRTGLQLADLKARLIVSRLSSIGEIISCEPPIDDAHSFEELPLFSLTLVTDRKIEDVRKVANVDGVESIEIKGGGLMTAMMAEVAASLMPTHAESSTNQPAAESSSAVVNSEVASCDVAHSEALKVDSPSVKSDGLDHSSYLANAIEDNSRSTEAKTNEVKSGEKEKNEAKTDGQEYPSSKSDNTEGKSSVSETLRVDIGRLDRLMNLTGELVVANARFTQIAGELNTMFRRNSVDSKSKDLTDRLKQSLQSIRTVCQETLPNREDLLHVFDGLDAELASLNDQAEIWEEG
ncbi:MAG: hypothetical protein FJ267_06255, partial [Planctomycetes bacterium]|nr:hypothetical protein [Planctomycetota bacterium]